jgi:Methyltransferase FkbM domain
MRVASIAKSFIAIVLLAGLCNIIASLVVLNAGGSTNSKDEFRGPLKANADFSFKSKVERCPKKELSDLVGVLKSQFEEDVYLLRWFNGICNGTYLEMGALDGVTFSNTYGLNAAFGWKGLLIELDPGMHQELVKNRPNELTTPVHAAVCHKPRTLHHCCKGVSNPPVHGIWEFSAESFRDMWWPGMSLANATAVKCRPLQTIIDESLPASKVFFDIFSLDIEGGEFMALQSIDFSRTGFGVLVIEADVHNEMKNAAMRSILEREGYNYEGHVGSNDWYVNKDFDKIYTHAVH